MTSYPPSSLSILGGQGWGNQRQITARLVAKATVSCARQVGKICERRWKKSVALACGGDTFAAAAQRGCWETIGRSWKNERGCARAFQRFSLGEPRACGQEIRSWWFLGLFFWFQWFDVCVDAFVNTSAHVGELESLCVSLRERKNIKQKMEVRTKGARLRREGSK